MFQNYLKIAFRNLGKRKVFAAINVFGLALGMTCCFLIVQYVWHETNYDTFHKDGDRLYRVAYHVNFSNEMTLAAIPPAFATQLEENFPEMETFARMYPRDVSVTVVDTDKQFEIEQAYFADSTITDVFDFDFIHGEETTALDRPFSVVLTDKIAKQFFGTTNVIGKELRLAGANNFRVTGVVKDWPEQAHTEIKMFVPYKNMADVEPAYMRDLVLRVLESNWTASHSYTYVKLKANQNLAAVNDKFAAYIDKYGTENTKSKQAFSLFPVKDIHLESEMGIEQKPTVSWDRIYLFIGIAIITLLIACINFINLTTASSLTRAKEVGVRKVLGAGKGALIGQFLGESVLLSFFAFLVSLLLTALAMPTMNGLTELNLVFAPWKTPLLFLGFIGIFLIAGLIAGGYPAFYVSKFQAIASLKGSKGNTGKTGGAYLQKALITIQFLATIAFISGAAIIYMQLNFFRNQPLGFEQELTLQVPIDSRTNLNAAFRGGDATLRQKMNTLDEVLLQNPKIKAVTQCSRAPGFGAIGRRVWNEHVPNQAAFTAGVNAIDYDYVETFGLEIVAGRDFDLSYGTDHLNSYMINEKGAATLGWESPEAAIGEPIFESGREGVIVGVLKDYHFNSLQQQIQPLLYRVNPGEFGNFIVRINNGDIPETISFVQDKWKEFFPEKAFEYEFLDQALDDAYAAEERFGNIITYFAWIAVLISCFGLFGLAALLTQHRFKEIGIRKILGASVSQIIGSLALDFLKLIGLAMVLAVPLVWYFMDNWLQDFAFRIDFPFWVPFAVGLGVVVLAFLTISSQTLKAALSNPVKALRYE
ncbi:MAG: ABC transporter permease [Saprospiraceae bacterium]